jgi:hypothetical protein
MEAYQFDVYDIDGTLTIPGHDLWYLSTRSLSADKVLFDSYVAEWNREIQSGVNPFESSLSMMKRGLQLLKNEVGSEMVGHEVQRITTNLIEAGLVWSEAIEFIRRRIRSGAKAVLSTTNYQEGAVGFLNALREKGWIEQAELEHISLSGSRIDWNSRVVTHFNMGSSKVIGLMDALGIDEEILKAKIGFVFGDDPLGNDRGLLEISPRAYVIRNEKNCHLDLPHHVKSTTWPDVQAMSISELTGFHPPKLPKRSV